MFFRHNPYAINILADCDRHYTVRYSCESSVASSFMSVGCPGSTSATPSCASVSLCESALTPTAPAKTPNTDAIANHYKTRPCKTFKATGCCSYESYCRFAHGSADLRTYAQNVRAGLVTEEAVREHQDAMAAKAGIVKRTRKAKTVNRKALGVK